MEQNQIIEKINKIHKAVPPDFYDESIKNNFFQRYWHKKRFMLVKNIMEGIQGNILDLGCHGGTLTNFISKLNKNNRLFGLDISKNAIDYASGRYSHIEFKTQDLNDGIPYPDNSFDAVTCFDVLEHVFDPLKLINETKRVLKNGGYFIVDIPNETLLFKFIWFFWTRMKGKVWRDVHINHFSPEDLEKLLEKNGFEKINEKKIHLDMLWIIKYKKSV